jgi:nicotinamide-nucleotide amidase
MTTAEIIAIGTELLLGETIDTNTGFIARALRGVGVNLYRTQSIGDNNDRIATVMREALSRAEIVITTGGLGPTVDDPTREAAALASGRLLEFHPELWLQITNRISRYGRVPTENQKKQAFLPQNALVIQNSVGTAPAFILELGQRSLICLPGVPREMETLLLQDVIPYLQSHFNLTEVIQIRTLHVSGLGEGVIDELVGDLESLSNPTVGLAAHSGVVSVRITAKGHSASDCLVMLDDVETQLRQRLGENLFGMDSDTLEGVVLHIADQKGWTIASIEFQTGNALATRLSKTSESSYRGGADLSQLEISWVDSLEKEMSNRNSNVGLGLACISKNDEHKAQIQLITPSVNDQVDLKYGGHPENFLLWAVNNALDLLRRKMLNSK